jgi:DNA repair protein RadC
VANLLEPFAGGLAEVAADRLIRHFGGLGRALAVTPEQLLGALAGDRRLAEAIVAARTLFEAGLRERISHAPVSIGDPAFHEYLRFIIGKSSTECLHATFVTCNWGYLADEQIASGTTAQVETNMRRLLGRAFDVGAHGIILAHNHPSLSAEPSVEDIELTRTIAQLTKSVGIRLLDHLIVGGQEIVSMRQRGLL